ncbi:MAG: hypothetical protein U0996_25300 [Planctomycetaceae bacterium]
MTERANRRIVDDPDPSGEFLVARSRAFERLGLMLIVMPVAFLFLKHYFQQRAEAIYKPTMALVNTQDEAVQAKEVCRVKDDQITEASGLAASYQHADSFWIHNDSGDQPRLFLVDSKGKTRLIAEVKDARAYDWEDMCSFRKDETSYLLIADTGDNGRVRNGSDTACRLYLVEEPKDELDSKKVRTIKLPVVSTIEFTYPDGPVDCESVAVDVEQNQILFVSKTNPFQCQVFSIPLELREKKRSVKATPVRQIGMAWATGMDVSPDGRKMVIVNPLSGVLVERQKDEGWSEAFARQAIPLTLPARAQGETVCFSTDGSRIYLNSEGQNQPLWVMPVPAE